MLPTPHLVDRLPEILRDVKFVMDDPRTGNAGRYAAHERFPHVHRNALNGLSLLQSQRMSKRTTSDNRSLGAHLQESTKLNVGHDRNLILAPAETLFVDAKNLSENLVGIKRADHP